MYAIFCPFLNYLCENDVIVVDQYEEITLKCALGLKSFIKTG